MRLPHMYSDIGVLDARQRLHGFQHQSQSSPAHRLQSVHAIEPFSVYRGYNLDYDDYRGHPASAFYVSTSPARRVATAYANRFPRSTVQHYVLPASSTYIDVGAELDRQRRLGYDQHRDEMGRFHGSAASEYTGDVFEDYITEKRKRLLALGVPSLRVELELQKTRDLLWHYMERADWDEEGSPEYLVPRSVMDSALRLHGNAQSYLPTRRSPSAELDETTV